MNSSAHILGAGGIGIAAATCLVRAGWDVTMVESNPSKVAAGRREGMMLDGQPTQRVTFVPFERSDLLAGFRIPQLDGIVRRTGAEPSDVRRPFGSSNI